MSGDREVFFMFNKLRTLIDRTYILKEEVQEKWKKKFNINFISDKLVGLLTDIERFQDLYDIDSELRIDTEPVLDKIINKFKIETEEREIELSIFQAKTEQWINTKLGMSKPPPNSKKRIIKRNYGKFTEDPTKDFIDLQKQAETIYHHYFQKYSIPELDVWEISLGPIKIRTRKNWKAIIGSIFIWLIYTGTAIAIGALIGFKF